MCLVSTHTYPHTHLHIQVHALANLQELCRYCVWHNWFILLILYSFIQCLPPKKVFLGIKLLCSLIVKHHNIIHFWYDAVALEWIYESWLQKTFDGFMIKDTVNAQREFVYAFPLSTGSEIVNSYIMLPQDLTEIQCFDQGCFSGVDICCKGLLLLDFT